MNEEAGSIDLEACLTSGQVFRWRQEEDAWVGVDGDHEFRLWQAPPAGGSNAHQGLSEGVFVEGSIPAFERLFRLDWDFPALYASLTKLGPELEPMIDSARGLRLLRPSCPRETLFSFLCTSNNHISRITQMVGKLAAYGPPLAATHAPTRFPSLERIADIPEQELRDLGFGYRAKTIPLVARKILVRGGEDWFQQMRATTYVQVFVELLDLPGVGPKLADCIALYAFDKTEATPTDTHLWQAVTRTYIPEWHETPLTETKRRYVGEFLRQRFGGLAGVAQQILFFDNLRTQRRRKGL